MSKTSEKDRAKDDEDLDDEAGSTDEGNDDGEEEEAKATAARGRGHGHAHDDDDDAEDDGAEPEDPYWWAPHAVLSALVLIGLLGFFGMFNKTPLARLAAPVAPEPDEHEHATAAAPPPAPTPRPAQSAQAPREMFGAKHLLVMYKGSRRAPPTIERTKDEAKARATEAMTKAKADPSKFADVVKEYSDEPGADKRGGDLGKFPKGAMVPEFQAGLEKIKVGQVSELVETAFGYHVILRTQ
ncbi:peptidylprolyl isomerase [Sorangium sp. So ce448]|uniref:peptidylprolyl isomerase n=1 Tax=unclassified Sorangium TaxID=2621164 RepID=UPI003F60BE50